MHSVLNPFESILFDYKKTGMSTNRNLFTKISFNGKDKKAILTKVLLATLLQPKLYENQHWVSILESLGSKGFGIIEK